MIVIGRKKACHLIRGKVKIGQEVVIRLEGKVESGIVVRTRSYSRTMVSFDKAAVMIKGGATRVKGPISKGVGAEYAALCKKLI